MKEVKSRTIYDNYDLWESLSEYAKDNMEDNEEPTEEEIWDEIYLQDSFLWEDEKERLENFFNDGSTYILVGSIGRWNGTYRGGFLFNDFMEMFYKATKDCDYVRIYDENGHFYIQCSHHDGTNLYEVKRLTEKGVEYYDNWNYGSDNRTEEYVHTKLMEKYSTLPHYAHKEFGCPKVEYVA